MPRIDPDQYMDDDQDDDFEILPDDNRTRTGQRASPRHIPKQDLDWEEHRREMQRRRSRDAD